MVRIPNIVRALGRKIPAEPKLHLKMMLTDLRKTPPVLVYQMAKVGSCTVYQSLRESRVPYSVYHLHTLTPNGLAQAETSFKGSRRQGRMPFIIEGKLLLKELNRSRHDIPWKVITLVREPIAREISYLFQTADVLSPEIVRPDGNLDVEAVVESLQRALEDSGVDGHHYNDWFDLELKTVFGVDIFEKPFEHERGYSLFHGNSVDVLAVRLEDLSRCFEDALGELIDLTGPVPMAKHNVSSQKKYADSYRDVVSRVKVTPEVCQRIYSGRTASHFYTSDEVEGFTRKWTRRSESPAT